MALVYVSAAVAQMTHEETVIRTAYARLSYAAELRIVTQSAIGAPGSARNIAELKAQVADLTPHFEIDNIAIGSLTSIAGQPWEQIVTKPDGDLIDVGASGVSPTISTRNGTTRKAQFYVMTGWSNHIFEPSWDGITVAQAVSESPKPHGEVYSVYASYRVRATLNGRNRTYNAVFLFGKDSQGNEAIHMIDHVVGMGSLDLVMSRSLYPEALLETYYRGISPISDWIAANTVGTRTDARDVSCSPSGCGLPANWVAKSFAVPIDPESEEFLPRTAAISKVEALSSVPGSAKSRAPGAANCSALSTLPALFPVTTYNTADHTNPGIGTGEHVGTFTGLSGVCTYSGNGSQPNCSTSCNVQEDANPTAADIGATSSGFCHKVNYGWEDGTSNGTYTGATCTGQAGFGAARCASVCDCSVTETFNGQVFSTSTVGGTILFSSSIPVPNVCATVADPQYLTSISVTPASASVAQGSTQQFTATGTYASGDTSNLTSTSTWTSSNTSVASVNVGLATGNATGTVTITASSGGKSGSATLTVTGGGCGVSCHCCTCAGGPPCESPIIVDTTGKGFRLTSAQNGVLFDIKGDGHPVQMAWTAPGSGNAFLALDRNGNGRIDSGKELFGNVTSQPKCAHPNGFLALDQFDKPENGGNGDGVIDRRDAVFSRLRLWIDENHNGISEPNELHTLEELGVYSLALNYTENKQWDSYGNAFRYKARVNPDGEPKKDQVDRWTYDVWFVTEEDLRRGHVQFGNRDIIYALPFKGFGMR